jgi:iron complex outermembrane receptor protein
VANINYSISESMGPVNMSLPVSVFEWDRQLRNKVDRQMAGTNGLPALSEQVGTGTSWGWGYNLAPRFNFKFSDEQTLSIATFFQKGFWNYRTDYVNRALTGSPVFDDDSIQDGYWENRRGNLTWVNRFSPDQRIEIKAGVQQARSSFDARNMRLGAMQLPPNTLLKLRKADSCSARSALKFIALLNLMNSHMTILVLSESWIL